MQVLLCGHRSFAARGLESALAATGHEVTLFSRGPLERNGNVVTGPVEKLHENPHLQQSFDTVVNYIMLKDDAIEPNLVFADSLLRFCAERKVPHLVHISSISSYKASAQLIDEDAEVEPNPLKKGPYGAVKTATDHALLKNLPATVKLTLVRPGFVLGPGLINPIIGTAARLPWNRLLVIGNAQSVIPMIARDTVSEAIVQLVANPPAEKVEVINLVSANSPTRKKFLEACCRRLGIAEGVTAMPVPIWYAIAIGGEMVARAIGQGKLAPYSKLVARLPRQRFDATKSQRRLRMDFTTDWENLLAQSLDAQEQNYTLPPPPPARIEIRANEIAFIGFGRIVKQRHLPALKKHGFSGELRAYDLNASTVDDVQVRAISDPIEPADLFVVATPGPAHIKAIPLLANVPGTVLVEKPLCYSAQELDAFNDFAASRDKPLYVCHNYRYKKNVLAMTSHLRQFNPGRLRHATVHFRSPPVSNDGAAWLRNERAAGTLLMDYALHFVDIACMFGESAWQIDNIRHEINSQSQTSLIEGHLSGAYSVSLLLRQGFGPRRARVVFDFENYSTALSFFPDTFAAYMADDNSWLYKREARANFRATVRKVADKLLSRDSDPSHAIVFAGAADNAEYVAPLKLERLRNFYQLLFGIAQRVYET
jgi:nucleoside-diphosphate-sugar epimerase